MDRLIGMFALREVTWRHDVDINLRSAVRMAGLEGFHGVRATYYVMVRSPYYNVLAHEAREQLEVIHSLEHTLGLHVDLGVPRDWEPTALRERIDYEWSVLHEATRPLPLSRRVSFHCPPAALIWRDLEGYESAYAARWEGQYRSDSYGLFRYGDPEDAEERPLQINLHPEHWCGVPHQGHEEFWR